MNSGLAAGVAGRDGEMMADIGADAIVHRLQEEDDYSYWVNDAGNCGGPEKCRECRNRLIRCHNLVQHEGAKLRAQKGGH